MPAIFYKGKNYSAVSTNEVADKETLDAMKAEIEELKATLASVSEKVTELAESGSGEVKDGLVFHVTSSAPETHEVEGKGVAYIRLLSTQTYPTIKVDGLNTTRSASTTEIYLDLFKHMDNNNYYVIPFNKTFYIGGYNYSGYIQFKE